MCATTIQYSNKSSYSCQFVRTRLECEIYMAPIQSHYQNITISGQIAAGTTTLLNNLKPHLAPKGWHFFSGGSFVREYSAQHNISLEDAAMRGDDFAKKLDGEITHRLQTETQVVIESWLAGFNAQGIDNVLKVLLVCSDESIIIDRVVNRDHVTVEEAKKHIQARTEANIAKWQRLYGDHDFWDPKYYDLVIDTYSNGPIETVELVLEKLGFAS